jgi:hypothetical protein
MKQKRRTVDQIIAKLRRADVLLGKGTKVPEVCEELGIAEQTYYRWRQKYGGMQPEMAKELKSLEKENARLELRQLHIASRWSSSESLSPLTGPFLYSPQNAVRRPEGPERGGLCRRKGTTCRPLARGWLDHQVPAIGHIPDHRVETS